MWRIFIILALTAGITVPSLAQENKKPAPTVRPCGIQIIGTGYGKDSKKWSEYLQPLRRSKGTRIAMLLVVPKGRILHFDALASQLSKFTDDKGLDLGSKQAGAVVAAGETQFYGYPEISKDGKAVIVDITSKKVPGKGAGKVSAEGNLVLWVGLEKKAFEKKDFQIKAGSKMTVGKLNLSLTKIAKDGDKLSITFEFEFAAGWNPIAAFEVKDAKGVVVKTKPSGDFPVANKWKVTYSLARQIDVATINLTLWTKYSEKKIPFKFELGVGLD